MNGMEEHMKRNNKVLEQMASKIDSLTEKIANLERAWNVTEGANMADHNKSPPTYDGVKATDVLMFSCQNIEMHPPYSYGYNTFISSM